MRRLPVYLLIDTSGSMKGEPIDAVKSGIEQLIRALRQDPYALETAFISVITFDSEVVQVVALTELNEFQVPKLEASGTTSLGRALALLSFKLETEVIKASKDTKGDWKPMVYILTDGRPTDDWKKGLSEYREASNAITIACAAGPKADKDALKEIGDVVLAIEEADEKSISAFFKWVSDSISANSEKIEHGSDLEGNKDLPDLPQEVNYII